VGALAPSDGIAGLTMLWKPHHLIRKRTSFDFLGKRKIALVLSSVINLAALVGVFVFGLNFGIDFEGGIAIQVRAKEGQVQLDNLRSELGSLGVGEVALQEFGDKSTALVRVQRQEGNAECVAHADAVMKRRAGNGWSVKPGPDNKTGDVDFTAPNTLDAGGWRDAVSQVGLTLQERQIPRANSNTARIDMSLEQRAEWCQQVAIKVVEDTIKNQYEIRSTESVGPKVGGELMQSGIWAVVATLGAIAVYVWFRFEWQFGVGALIALLHDVLSTVGIFVLFHLDFSLTALAALLTIAGYSVNDTVVIFDRVRENMRRYKKMGLIELLNFSINETLARTIMTAGTVFVAVLALVLFGGPVLYSFSIAMLWGVIVGTYSSIWIASACLVYMKLRPEQLRLGKDDEAKAKA
jgi:preprotein translocase subunit SecF